MNQKFEPGSPPLQADSLPSEPPGKPHVIILQLKIKGVKKASHSINSIR